MEILRSTPTPTFYTTFGGGGASARRQPLTPSSQPLGFDTSGVSASSPFATIGRGAIRYPFSPSSATELNLEGPSNVDSFIGGRGLCLDTSTTSVHRSIASRNPSTPADGLLDVAEESPSSSLFGGTIASAAALSSVPQLMSQTRLVHTRLSQIRNELEAVVQAVWRPEGTSLTSSTTTLPLSSSPLQSRGPSMAASSSIPPAWIGDDSLETLISEPHAAGVSLTTMHDGLGVVERQIVATQHTRRIVIRSMERPLAEVKAKHEASSPPRRSAAAAGAALRNRVLIAIEFGEQEVRLLLRDIQTLQNQLLAVERRLLILLGVTGSVTASDDTNGAGHDIRAGAVGSAIVFRRREGADVASLRKEVENSMRRDSRYAQLHSAKAALQEPPGVGQQRQSSSSTFRAAGAAAKSLVEDCGWVPNRVQYRSQYLYELDHIDELIAHEHEKQLNIAEGRSAGASPNRNRAAKDEPPVFQEIALDDAHTANQQGDTAPLSSGHQGPDGADPLGLEKSAPFARSAPVSEHSAGDIEGANSSMAELAAALHRLSPLPSTTKSDGDAASAASHHTPLLDTNPDALPPSAEPSSAPPNFAEVVDAVVDETTTTTQPPVMGAPPTPVHFQDHLRTYIRNFLRSGACQWVACVDEATQATFYFNLDTAEREDSLEGYFSDTVAESIAQKLLDEGEREGWIFVPGGSTEYGDDDYYCHQRSGETTWSLVDYVKQH